jgi:hypothetical protein
MPKSNKHFTQKFQVKGKYPFPLDMLRYDSCFPYSQEDVVKIQINLDLHSSHCSSPETTIMLMRCVETKADIPTKDRWNSFGWAVIAESTEVS